MISRIHGVLLEVQELLLLVDVQGVGYEIHVPMSTVYQLPLIGEAVTLHTHLVVREDAQLLFGFANQQERRLFRALIKVNGVGPKLAQGILSGIESDDFVRCVRDDDAAALVRIPGVGKKTAERLLIEMRDRLKDWHSDTVSSSPEPMQLVATDYVGEAESALVALGYKPQDASRAVSAVNDGSAESSASLIRMALKNMVKR